MSRAMSQEKTAQIPVVQVSLPEGAQADLVTFVMGLPGAYLDMPWGDLVAKVNGKIFVFFGIVGDRLGFTVKLPQSGSAVLDREDAHPTGYGLGKHGWVSLSLDGQNPESMVLAQAWVTESWLAVAPKRLVKAHPEVGARIGR
jgi:predicted DNA-binding protein (MmcQ/YjbR family)